MMAVMVMLYTTVLSTKMKILMAGQGTVAGRPKASGYKIEKQSEREREREREGERKREILQ